MQHKTNRRVKMLTAIVIPLALITAACGSSAPNGQGGSTVGTVKHQTIGYIDIVAAGGMQIRWYNFLTAAADKLGWDVKLVDAGGVATKALQGMQRFVSEGVSAIVVSCVDTGPLMPGLRAAKAANIPVIALGCAVPEPVDAWDAVYAEQEQPLAEALSAYLVTELKKQDCNKVSVLQDRTILVGRQRSDFFISALKKANFDVVSTPVIPETSIVPSTQTAVSATLAADPATCAFVPIFDFSVGATVAQLKSLGKADSVSVYSYYADNVNLPLLLEPKSSLKGVVDGPVEQVSLVAISELLNHFQTGDKIDRNAADNLKIDFNVITAANAPKNIPNYITPWDTNEYLAPFISEWNKKYGLSLK